MRITNYLLAIIAAMLVVIAVELYLLADKPVTIANETLDVDGTVKVEGSVSVEVENTVDVDLIDGTSQEAPLGSCHLRSARRYR